MRGIVTFDDVMDVLEEEATEDLISLQVYQNLVLKAKNYQSLKLL